MKKGMLLVVALLLVGSSAFATEARDNALQSDGWMVMDDTNIAGLPTNVIGYKGAMYTELDWPNAGVILGVGPGVLGLWAGNLPLRGNAVQVMSGMGTAAAAIGAKAVTPINPMAIAGVGPIAGGLTSTTPANGRLAAIYGLSLSGGMNVAGGLEYASDNNGGASGNDAAGDSWGTFSDGASLINIVGGVSLGLAMFDPLEVGVRVSLPGFNTKYYNEPADVTQQYAGGAMGIDLAVRGSVKDMIGENTTSLLYLSFGTVSASAKTTDDSLADETLEEQTISGMGVTLGLANNVRVGDGTLVVWGAGVDMMNMSDKVEDVAADLDSTASGGSLTVSAIIAMETKILSWLTGRVSSTSAVINSQTQKNEWSTDDAVDETSLDQPSQAVALGLSVAASDRVTIDMVLNQGWMYTGPFLIGGATAGPMFTSVSVVGRF
jgi:hypothetical protein